jgi:hypothetical protein
LEGRLLIAMRGGHSYMALSSCSTNRRFLKDLAHKLSELVRVSHTRAAAQKTGDVRLAEETDMSF